MNILWIDHATRHGRHDDWLHYKFAKKIAKYANIYFYAPFIHEKEPTFTPIRYEPNILLADVVKELKIDVVILDTKSTAFHNYLPDTLYHDKHMGNKYWLPNDFKTCDVLKICIDEDFQYETSYDWYEEHGFKAILQKHIIHTTGFKGNIPVYSFPFSVDIDSFQPSGEDRIAKVGFAGTQRAGNAMSGVSVYLPREKASEVLHSVGLLAPKTVTNSSLMDDNYIDYLQQYISYLSGGSVYKLTPAKMTEIIASGGILITDKTYGLDQLFPDDIYITYNDNASDLVGKIKELFDNPKRIKTMVAKGIKCIKEKHSHDIRIKEMLKIIRKYL